MSQQDAVFNKYWNSFELPWGIRWARPMVEHIAHLFFDYGYFSYPTSTENIQATLFLNLLEHAVKMGKEIDPVKLAEEIAYYTEKEAKLNPPPQKSFNAAFIEGYIRTAAAEAAEAKKKGLCYEKIA